MFHQLYHHCGFGEQEEDYGERAKILLKGTGRGTHGNASTTN
jgi:hypothetical protein